MLEVDDFQCMNNQIFYRNRLPHIHIEGAIQFITFSINGGLRRDLLADPRLAAIVEEELLRFCDINYKLYAYVIMPSHVHVLIALRKGFPLHKFTKQLKGASSFRINKVINSSGTLWLKDSFDHYVRNEYHFREKLEYIKQNPVVAGRCSSPEKWRFSSAYWDYKAKFCEGD